LGSRIATTQFHFSDTLLGNAPQVHDLIIHRKRRKLTKLGIAIKLNTTEKRVTKAIDFFRGMGYPQSTIRT
jgi:hypothetical protein